MSQNGALTQLVAVGAQEKNFLSKDPKDSIFKEPTKKINNFVKETHSMYPTGTANWGTTTRFRIDKRGDLLNSLYFVAKLPKLDRSFLNDNSDTDGGDGWKLNYVRWVNYIGNVLIKKVRLYIGGDLIDEQSGEFMQVYTDIQDDDWNKLCLIGMDSELNRPVEKLNQRFIYVPLKFWFCANIKKALPIIAIRHQDIEVEIDIRNWDECYQVLKLVKITGKQEIYNYDHIDFVNIQKENKMSEQPLEGIRLDCNFSYVDDKERRHLVEQDYKILITQTQSIKTNIISHTIDLDFNHPVKELFWFYSNKTIRETPDPYNFCNIQENPDSDVSQGFLKEKGWGSYNHVAKNTRMHWMDEARILVNGRELIGWNNWKYYYYVQNYEHYRNKLEHFVYLYSFSTNPKGLTPSGSLNFSRIDNAQLQFKMNKKTQSVFNGLRERSIGDTTRNYMTNDNQFDIHIYAVNYNYLIIKNGMAALVYKT